MKRIAGVAIVTVLLLAALVLSPDPVSTQVRNAVTPAVLQGRAWTFTAMQTFSGGVKIHSYEDGTAAVGERHKFTDQTFVGSAASSSLPLSSYYIDLGLSPPAAGPSPGTLTGVIGCSSSVTYRFYATWANQSGETVVGPPSADFQPSVNNRTVQLTQPAGAPSAANSWRIFYSKDTELHSTIRQCQGATPVYTAVATTVAGCACSATGGAAPTSNTTGPVDLFSIYDGEIRSVRAGAAPQAGFTGVRMGLGSAAPSWSSDGGATTSAILIAGPNVEHVCKSGCEHQTVGSAMSSITDNSSTKRYTILIFPGDYDETVIMKSYVSLVGVSRSNSRIRAAAPSTASVSVPADVTEIGVFNLTTNGYSIDFSSGSASQTTAYIYDNNLGIVDGTGGPAGDAIDCIRDFGVPGRRDIYMGGNLCRSKADMLITGQYSRLYSTSDIFISDKPDLGAVKWVRGRGEFVLVNPVVLMSDETNSNYALYGIHYEAFYTARVRLTGGQIHITSTNASRTEPMECFHMDGFAAADPALLDIADTVCTVVSASSSGAVNGLMVTADAEHSASTIRWNGGRISVSGGAAPTDITNAETVGGFTLSLSGVESAGVYSGAGSVTAGDHRLGAFTTRLLGRVGDLVAGTCVNNEIALDTGGANNEICICTGGAWSCATVTTAAGPTN